MPSVGTIGYYDPFTGEPKLYAMPAGGRGYIRPPSLISLWSTAPFLQNNTMGPFHPNGSVDDRMASFEVSIRQLLWPEKRDTDPVFGDRIPGAIDRTTDRSYFILPPDDLPGFVMWVIRQVHAGWIDKDGNLRVGPFPKGMPVGLIANLELVPDGAGFWKRMQHFMRIAPSVLRLAYALWSVPENATDEQLNAIFGGVLEPLLKFSKCPDFVVNRGHYFGTDRISEEPGLSDSEKNDLIEFLKTL
jgi:hypothetical protein